ncbi:19787_t:CDS:10, partial [Gigaspora margarita]
LEGSDLDNNIGTCYCYEYGIIIKTEKEIINISIKLFWDDNSSAIFNGPLEFTTTLNHADKPIHSDIYDLLLPINNVSLEEGSCLEAMVQANYIEYTEKNQANEDELMLNNQISPQEQSKVSIDQYNEQFGFQDDQRTDIEMTDSSSNQYPIVLIPNANMQAMNLLENIRKDKQGSSQIDDSEDEINDNSESSEIQVEDNTVFSDHQSDDSLPQKKDNKSLRINRLVRNFDKADSDAEDKLTLSDTNNIVEVQIA